MSLTVHIISHNHIVPTSARFLESPLFCKLFVCARIFISTSNRAHFALHWFHFALHWFHFVLHGFHYNLSMTIDFQQKCSLRFWDTLHILLTELLKCIATS